MSSITNKKPIVDKIVSTNGKVNLTKLRRVLSECGLLHEVAAIKTDLSEAFYWWAHDLKDYPKKCRQCAQAVTKFSGWRTHYSQTDYCSVQCAAYGCVDKRRQTCEDRYGVHSPAQAPAIMQKMQQTCEDRYGTRCYLTSNDGLVKAAQTVQARYGADRISRTQHWRSKTSATKALRWGADNTVFGANSKINEGARETLSRSIGEPWPNDWSFQQLTAWKASHTSVCTKAADRGFSVEAIDNTNRIVSARHQCGRAGQWSIGNGMLRCSDCDPIKYSRFEQGIAQFLNSLGVSFERNDRKKIAPLELDFFIPSHNLAIECNGDYWHSYSSPESAQDRGRHLRKLEICEAAGIRLIQIKEHLWHHRQPQIEAIIQSALGNNSTVFARKCSLQDVPLKQARAFCEKFHVQGAVGGQFALGLYHGRELVQVAIFGKPRFRQQKDKDLELLRLCTLPGRSIVGGVSKILSAAVVKTEKSVVTYIDRMLFNGAAFAKISRQLQPTKPSYEWIYRAQVLTRFQTQKGRLSRVLGEQFDPNLSEHANMFAARAARLWDCGNHVFIFS